MTILRKTTTDRLDLAEQILRTWEQMVTTGALSIYNLPLAQNEVKNLAAYREDDPVRVDDLIKRFQVIADRLRQQLN